MRNLLEGQPWYYKPKKRPIWGQIGSRDCSQPLSLPWHQQRAPTCCFVYSAWHCSSETGSWVLPFRNPTNPTSPTTITLSNPQHTPCHYHPALTSSGQPIYSIPWASVMGQRQSCDSQPANKLGLWLGFLGGKSSAPSIGSEIG